MTKFRVVPLTVSFLLLSCTSKPTSTSTTADTLREPTGNYASPEWDSLLNFNLAPGEQWKGGNKEAEIVGFLNDAQDVHAASMELFQKNKDKIRSGRVFHEKSHGCLTGTLKLSKVRMKDPDRRTFVGLFNPSEDDAKNEFPVIARFSNGVGVDKHDADPDVRGLALKVFYTDDKNQEQAVDFLMTNATNPLGRDHAQFVAFMKENLSGNFNTFNFFISEGKKQDPNSGELPYFRHFTRSVIEPIPSAAKERYWSGHPYLLGQNTHMKFNVQPVDYTEADQRKYDHRGDVSVKQAFKAFVEIGKSRVGKNHNYLRADLLKKAKAGPLKYVFSIQIEKDQVSTPVENTLVEWTEKEAPSIPVAELILDQQNFEAGNRDAACSQLRFTPGHYHPEHRPTGNMGRGRLYSYLASQNARKAKKETPSKTLVEEWRKQGVLKK